ncbi:uncharacterized protein LOC135492440 [Lineus longissimus]|uniref:uncharacterized protein LOC135492440 n=1 Tax=Lineus longissimus TaxID=88925 RepID=UPI00315D1BA6
MEVQSARCHQAWKGLCSKKGRQTEAETFEMSPIEPDGELIQNPTLSENCNRYDMPLNDGTFRKWYDILKADDISQYQHVMAAAEDEMKTRLVNGRFVYGQSHLKQSESRVKITLFCRPIIIASSFCSQKCFLQLLKDGADVSQHDINDNNCIHSLVIANSFRREMEESYMRMFECIQDICDVTTLQSVLMSENSDHMRPLELATRLGTYGLFRAFLETTGVYKKEVASIGIHSRVKYNLLEYEQLKPGNMKRWLRSPLRLLCFMEKDHLNSFLTNGIHKMPCILHWMNTKEKNNRIYVIIWMILRSIYIILLTTMDMSSLKPNFQRQSCDQMNRSDATLVHWACRKSETDEDGVMSGDRGVLMIGIATISAILFSVLIIVGDVMEFVRTWVEKERRLLWNMGTQSTFVAHTNFYRVCQLGMALICSFGAMVAFALGNIDSKPTMFMKTLNLPLILLSVLYVLEPIPVFGIFASTLQRMVAATVKFSLLYGFIEFVFTFYILTLTDLVKTTSISKGMYYMFLSSLNIVDFGPNPEPYVKFVHVLHNMVANIFLVNYLIAVMTNLASEPAEVTDIVQSIRKLDISYLVEERTITWFRNLTHRCKKMGEQDFTVLVV